MLKRAYELSNAGDLIGAARECESEHLRDQSLVTGVEGIDFYVLAGAPDEALRFAEPVRKRINEFLARIEFFRSLALWDVGNQTQSREALQASLRLGYQNQDRIRMEWLKRVDETTLAGLLGDAGSAQ